MNIFVNKISSSLFPSQFGKYGIKLDIHGMIDFFGDSSTVDFQNNCIVLVNGLL